MAIANTIALQMGEEKRPAKRYTVTISTGRVCALDYITALEYCLSNFETTLGVSKIKAYKTLGSEIGLVNMVEFNLSPVRRSFDP